MRTAKDGKPFDVDNLGDPGKGEAEVIQFLRPNGRRRRMLAEVGWIYVKLAEKMILSAEELTTGDIAVYARFQDEDEEKEIMELAVNGPGEHSPAECLKRLIRKKSL